MTTFLYIMQLVGMWFLASIVFAALHAGACMLRDRNIKGGPKDAHPEGNAPE